MEFGSQGLRAHVAIVGNRLAPPRWASTIACMARLSRYSRTVGRSSTRSPASRTLPFLLLGQAAIILRDHWRNLPAADRDRLAELLKASGGRPMNLTPQQRTELSNIVKRSNIPALARDLTPLASRRATHRRVGLRRR